MHGFFQRALSIDTDIDPARANDVTVTPTQAGSFPVICDHYFGYGHGSMKMIIVVQ